MLNIDAITFYIDHLRRISNYIDKSNVSNISLDCT